MMGNKIRGNAVKRVGQGRQQLRPARGFTLIELMTVVAIVAILVAIALPSYHDSVRKGRRGQAKADLVEIAQRAERWRTVNGSFAGFELEESEEQSPQEGDDVHYEVSLEVSDDDTEFLLTAEPQGGQANDTHCMSLTLNQAGTKAIDGGTGTAAECW